MTTPPENERWLTFEVGQAAFALPILDVFEVSDVARIGPVPSLPRDIGGVMPYHGDALPVLSASTLLGVPADAAAGPEHVIVVADAGGDRARLGIPVDRVLGLVDAPAPSQRQAQPVSAHMPLDGRVTGILDAAQLCRWAEEVVARAGSSDPIDCENGGKT